MWICESVFTLHFESPYKKYVGAEKKIMWDYEVKKYKSSFILKWTNEKWWIKKELPPTYLSLAQKKLKSQDVMR